MSEIFFWPERKNFSGKQKYQWKFPKSKSSTRFFLLIENGNNENNQIKI